jgi:hypothetical protein
MEFGSIALFSGASSVVVLLGRRAVHPASKTKTPVELDLGNPAFVLKRDDSLASPSPYMGVKQQSCSPASSRDRDPECPKPLTINYFFFSGKYFFSIDATTT